MTVRLVQVGAGAMGRAWIRTIRDSPDAELVGLVDLDVDLATAAAEEEGVGPVAVGTSVAEVAARSGADAVVNVTVPRAHLPVSSEALFAGLPVLSEKPIAPTIAEALVLAATAEASGRLLMTSQSRRYYSAITAFREQIAGLGQLGTASVHFAKAPRFGGFRDEMDHVLLVDMAIHAFDAARYLLDSDPVAVYCEEYNPGWSWYADGAAASAVFEFAGGVRFSYTGSWCADGLETSWNGDWRVNGAGGTAHWDGDGAPEWQSRESEPVRTATLEPVPEEIAGSLAEFVRVLGSGAVPSGEVHSNVRSLAMVEAAVRSSETGARVRLDDVLEEGYAEALTLARDERVRAALGSWGSAAEGLAR
ncbi:MULTISPECIES: Gfo/Idh/MocA family protein [unclassified Rathayibacter]|uniref:Gfo/Idh/MocA family protein n=1 Tax=unclassified Rathayibacter TaxID=2609250 RepID=UPI000CE74ABC|nr:MULTISPECIES: Gfo/Idh/MocA family oxidoreductase [unclassified Rathayibacter]PPF16048.1 oxidoreductase [Rathayibacter sp. AY1A4]PPG80630.1 oxidoreductase [Rathayibacter sp. AY1E5]PPH30840.1 oxidoreductase [Rathayibacter sp. AY1C3]PPH60553.1 oxidoreductase [Rathayibacter sp. AY1D7]PPI29128.1 oxidoreductase [Rathayibacter sp. AY1B4]